jgi:hypothetical protein
MPHLAFVRHRAPGRSLLRERAAGRGLRGAGELI